jgi:hypothetical protein
MRFHTDTVAVMVLSTTIMLMLLVLLLAGCTSAPTAEWVLYAKANYMYGVNKGRVQALCMHPASPDIATYCKDVAAIDQQVQAITPVVEAQLSQQKPDWPTILHYVDLIMTILAKVPIP